MPDFKRLIQNLIKPMKKKIYIFINTKKNKNKYN